MRELVNLTQDEAIKKLVYLLLVVSNEVVVVATFMKIVHFSND